MRNRRFSFPVNPLVGSSFTNIVALWSKYRIDLKYYPKFLLTLLIAGVFEIFNLWEKVFLSNKLKVDRMKEPPVFIIGFWRSGTTLLHNLLCSDPDAGYTTTFQVVFPHSTLTQAWWLKKLTNLLLPPDRPFDNVSMDMDFPQEDEYGLAAMQTVSFYNMFNFPKDFDQIYKQELFLGNLEQKKLSIWKNTYYKLIRKALLNTNGSRYISKNPCNLCRIELLLSMYPQARFIFIYRNPYQVAESLYRFILAIFPGTQLQSVPEDFNRQKIVKLYSDIMNQYFKSRRSIPQSQLIEIKMEDFVKDKAGYLRRIYQDFNLPRFDEALPFFEKYIEENSGYKRDAYEMPAEIYGLMNQYAPDIIKKLGYSILMPEQCDQIK